MIVLRVVLEDPRLLFVIEGPYELVDTKVFPPLFTVYEPGIFSQLRAINLNGKYLHLFGKVYVELSRA